LDHADTVLIANVGIRNTDLAGVGFIGSDHPQLQYCSILDTAKKGFGRIGRTTPNRSFRTLRLTHIDEQRLRH
jgi:hypothetical protein